MHTYSVTYMSNMQPTYITTKSRNAQHTTTHIYTIPRTYIDSCIHRRTITVTSNICHFCIQSFFHFCTQSFCHFCIQCFCHFCIQCFGHFCTQSFCHFGTFSSLLYTSFLSLLYTMFLSISYTIILVTFAYKVFVTS